MTDRAIGRRGFLLAGGAAAIGAATLRFTPSARAAARLAPPSIDFSLTYLAGSGEWEDVSATAVFARLADPQEFGDARAAARALDGPVVVDVLGGSVTDRAGIDGLEMGIVFPGLAADGGERVFGAMRASKGETPSLVTCRAPANPEGVPLLVTTEIGEATVSRQRLFLPRRRGIFLLTPAALGSARARIAGGSLITDDSCGVLLVVHAPENMAGTK